MYRGLGSTIYITNPGIVTFEMQYDLWLEEQRKKDDELRKVLMTYTSETDLRIFFFSILKFENTCYQWYTRHF